MTWFKRLFGHSAPPSEAAPVDQSILITLDGVGLPDWVYQECDLDRLEERLVEVMADLGEYDGNETRETTTVVYLYGRDAEAMYAAIEPALNSYPLCAGATVTIRSGGPGAEEREVQIPRSSLSQS